MDIMNAFKTVTEQIKNWSNDKLSKKVDKVGGKSLSTNDYTQTDKSKVDDMATGLKILEGKLFLSNDSGIIENSGVTLPSGGGGGGTGNESVTLKNELDSTTIIAALNGDVLLKFNYSSTEDDGGTAYIYINDVLKATVKISSGSNTINIKQYVGEGSNIVKLTCVDQYSNSKSLSYTANIISLKLTSTFDDSQIFDGDVTIRYIATGAISKDLHMVLDSVDTVVDTTSETGKQRAYIISKDKLYHGVHDITLYLSAVINDVEVVSNKLNYSIVATESGSTVPIISSVCMADVLTQGEQLQINYLVYDPSNIETEVSLLVYNNNEIYSETKRIVNATKQIWSTRDLPIGDITLKIVYGVVERSHQITVLKNNVDITINETDLEFNLSSAGRSNADSNRDVWESNGITTTFQNINYESTGWILDKNGDSVLRLSGEAKAIINAKPFLGDARQNGKTIELEFAIRSVNNRDAIAIQCFDGSIGFQVKADTASISSEQSSVSCKYTDEEKVYVSFVIEPRTEFCLLYIYLNGVISGVKQYPETDNWQMQNPVNITVGSPYCSVDLYTIRSYNTALSQDEVLNNYIASITDVSEKLAVYENNNIYDDYGNLSFDKLKDKIPIVVVTGPSLPAYKGDKKKMSVSFIHPDKPSLDYSDSSIMNVQGTSSQFFIIKNFKSKTSKYHMIDTDKIETNIICLKADYMDSSGSHNTAGVNYVSTLYEDAKVPPQETDSRIRTTVWGFPCLLFQKTDISATPKFIGKYNYNYDKSSLEAFGFTNVYPDAFSIEFSNNTSDECLFHGELSDSWKDNFEYRYPEDYEDINDSGFKEMHSWVVSTYQEAATGNVLDQTYTGIDGVQYTSDTAEYRLAKFKKEFTEHFDMNFALVYYVYAMTGIYMDSLAKNLFLTTFDRKHWYCYWYDLDTAWGVNNEGVLAYSPFLEDIDMLDGSKVFNGQDSSLWVNFRQAFADEIASFYANLRSKGLLTYDKIIEYFITNHTDRWSEAIYNEDEDFKYISMLRSDGDASNLFQAQGTGKEHLRYFSKNRLMYLDSKWYAGDYPDDIVSLRIYTPSGDLVVKPNANITVTPYSNMYVGVRYKANGFLQQKRAESNIPVTFEAPNEIFNDTESAIYGASQISSLGDLSSLYCGTINLTKATKLVEIIVGNGTKGYSNGNLKEITVGTNTLLKKIDIQNCPNLTDPLGLSQCPNIEEIYAQGTGITAIELPSSGYLKICKLPNTLTNLTVTNQQYIQDFTLEGYDNLTTLRIENTVNVPVEDIMLNAPNLNRIRLIDVTWNAESESALVQTIEKFKSCLGLDANGNNTNKAVVTGRVHVAEKVSDAVVGDIYNNFPDLVVDDGSDKLYIVNYKDWDGTILYSYRVAEGENAIDPIAKELITAPSRKPDENYSYEFVGWNNLPTNINRHYQIIAQYRTMVAVNFAVDGKIIHSEYVIYGSSAEDPVANGTIQAPTKEGTDDLHYVFKGWDGSLLNITIPRTINALWNNVYPVRFYTDSNMKTLHHVQWVVEGENAHDPVVAGDCAAPADIITENEKKLSFSAWNNLPQNVTAINKVYANYDIYWAARFLNDGKLYLLEWTLDGSDVVEPKDYFEDYTNPTRESTAQYDYAFSKWDGNFKAITEARDYNATYTNTVRRYRVRFYNDTTLLQTVKDVPYGSSATYTGSTPTKLGVSNPEEYIFKGWLPATENITGDTDYYALFKFTGYLFGKLGEGSDYGTVDAPNWDLINAYWDTIDNDIKTLDEDALFVKYPIGGRMVIPVALSDGTVTADVEIIAHNHDSLADDTGLAPLTFFCVDLPQIQHAMNQNKGNVGGWKDSDMREFVNNDLLNALPSQLTAIIKPVTKLSDGGSNNKTIVETTDNCWIASAEEVGLTLGNSGVSGQGKLYDSIFSSDKDTRKKYITDDTSAGGWWTRSSYYSQNNSSLFYRVTTNGTSYTDIAFNSFYVAFGFCI